MKKIYKLFSSNISSQVLRNIGLMLFLLFLTACGGVKYIPVENNETVKINYRDSIRIKDSIIVTPIERIKDVVPIYDTLKLETSLAYSETYVDTNSHSLIGKIENKKEQIEKHSIEYRVIEKSDTVVVYKETPIEVKTEIKYVPKVYKIVLIYSILITVIVGLTVYFKFKKII